MYIGDSRTSPQDVVNMIVKDTARHKEAAERYLQALIQDAQGVLDRLQSDQVMTSISGAVLNAQTWQDAERSLVRWRDAAAYGHYASLAQRS